MNALTPLVSDLLVSDSLNVDEVVVDASDFEEYLSPHLMAEDDIKDHLRRFAAHCEKQDWSLTEEQEIQNFAFFFKVVQEALMTVGSFSESRMDEADFTARRDIDPTHVLRVKSAVPVTDEIVVTTLAACVSLGSDYAIVFDEAEGRSVLFSNGDFLRAE